jgi:hypothetical protein
MNDKHNTELLDNTPLASLSPGDREQIRSHADMCEPCRDAFAAAQLSAAVIKERAQLVTEPSPFFQTRVMAAWREQQATESGPALWRLWKSARALVSSMALTTAALAALSFMVSAPAKTSVLDQTAAAPSAESVILGQDNDDQLTYEQVLNTIYVDAEDK